jgi:hypothetical protein
MDDFIATSKHNTQIARIFRLRAEAPEKYREEIKVMNVEAPLKMLDKLAEIAARERKEQKTLETPAIEGQYRDVTVSGAEPPAVEPPRSESEPITPPQPPAQAPAGRPTAKGRLISRRMEKRGRQFTRR